MRSDAGRALVGLLVAGVIVVAAPVLIYTQRVAGANAETPEDGPRTVVGAALQESEETQLRSNLQQVRMWVQMNTDPVSGDFPPSLEGSRLGSSVLVDPISEQPLNYDPTTGRVWSSAPGYENL